MQNVHKKILFTSRERRIFVNKPISMELDIVHDALHNLQATTGLPCKWINAGPLDGVLEVSVEGNVYPFVVAVKREVRTHHLQQIEEYNRRHPAVLLLAQRIFPKIRSELRHKGIAYIEANGNVYLKHGTVFLFVDGQDPLDLEKNKGNRAFTKTGLKVLFQLLQDKDAIHLPQRELAKLAGVALGNIPQVIEGLKETGYLIPFNRKRYVWENRKTLLERWIDEYAAVLRPKLVREKYTLKANWHDVRFDVEKTVWGGEPAADLLTHHLRPEKFIVYTKESRLGLVRNYGLIPDADGEVTALELFWNVTQGATAPPLLVYADLMLEGGKRNKETARKIYDAYIEPNL